MNDQTREQAENLVRQACPNLSRWQILAILSNLETDFDLVPKATGQKIPAPNISKTREMLQQTFKNEPWFRSAGVFYPLEGKAYLTIWCLSKPPEDKEREIHALSAPFTVSILLPIDL